MKDEFYLKLAKNAGSNWKEIAVCLGIDYDSLDQLPSQVAGNPVLCAMEVFVRWRKSGRKTLRDLHDALMDAQEGAMAAFVVQSARQYRRGGP